jgi:hypothetical protein
MSHNYNGDGVQAKEYSALAGSLDTVILRTFATNSNVLGGWGGREFTFTIKHINLIERTNKMQPCSRIYNLLFQCFLIA